MHCHNITYMNASSVVPMIPAVQNHVRSIVYTKPHSSPTIKIAAVISGAPHQMRTVVASTEEFVLGVCTRCVCRSSKTRIHLDSSVHCNKRGSSSKMFRAVRTHGLVYGKWRERVTVVVLPTESLSCHMPPWRLTVDSGSCSSTST